jgi:pilus assembly protein FimV
LTGGSFGGGGGPGGFAGAPGAAGFGGAAATGGFAGAAGADGAAGLPGTSPGGVPPEAAGEVDGTAGAAGFSASGGRGGCFSSESLVMSPKGVQKLHSCQALAAPKFRAHTHKSGANRTVTSNTRHHARQPRKKIPGRQILPGKPRNFLLIYTHSSAPLR